MKRAVFFTQSTLLLLMGLVAAGQSAAMLAEYQMMLRIPGVYAAAVALCALAAVVAAAKASVQELAASPRCLPVILPLSLVYGMSLLWLADWRQVLVQLVVCLVCCMVLHHKCARSTVLDRICRIICVLLLPLFLLLLVGATVMADFGRTTIVEAVRSPDGRYEAQLIDVDEGALGGSTVVDVQDESAGIDLGVARFEWIKRVYRTGWGAADTMEITWQDEHTLLIDGQAYDMQKK